MTRIRHLVHGTEDAKKMLETRSFWNRAIHGNGSRSLCVQNRTITYTVLASTIIINARVTTSEWYRIDQVQSTLYKSKNSTGNHTYPRYQKFLQLVFRPWNLHLLVPVSTLIDLKHSPRLQYSIHSKLWITLIPTVWNFEHGKIHFTWFYYSNFFRSLDTWSNFQFSFEIIR